MKNVFATVWILILAALCVVAPAQDRPALPVSDSQTITTGPQLLYWFDIHYQGKSYGMAWGLDPVIAERLKSVASSRQLAETFESNNRFANWFFWGGLPMLYAGVSGIGYGLNNRNGSLATLSAAGTIVAVLCLSASFSLSVQNTALLPSAIENYNRDKTADREVP